jgi:hypothetical protein
VVQPEDNHDNIGITYEWGLDTPNAAVSSRPRLILVPGAHSTEGIYEVGFFVKTFNGDNVNGTSDGSLVWVEV